MSFVPSARRPAPASRPAKLVLAVGQRVFVNRPDDATRPVMLTDERGIPCTAGLCDGTEVEIVAWRPRGQSGTRYRVRNRRDGADGWLAADDLRATALRAPVVAPVARPVPDAQDTHRPFGARR